MNRKPKQKPPSPLSLRLTTEERRLLEIAAAGRSLSGYVRSCVFDESGPKRRNHKREPVEDEKALAQALGLLGQSRIANNLNQLARAANSGSLIVDEETRRNIEEAYEHVRAMRDSLVCSLGLIEERSP